MGRRFGIDFSSILVGLEGQVGRPNRAKREPKHDLAGQERPQQGKRPRQVNQVKLSQWRRKSKSPYLGGEGFTLPKRGGPPQGSEPLVPLGVVASFFDLLAI